MNDWMLKILVAFSLWFATFTPAERIALGSAFLVLVGVVGEYVADIESIEAQKHLHKRIQRLSMAVLLLGLSGDVLGIVMGQAEMTALTREAGDAASSARVAHLEAGAVKGIADEARADAKDALAKAQAAEHELARAESDAAKAQTVSAEALRSASDDAQVARGVKKELTETAEELKRIRSQRSILHPEEVSTALRQFSGTQYVFSGVGADEDSLALIKQIDDILQKAGWKRQPAHGRFPAINVFEPNNTEDSITVALVSGVLVSVDSQEELAVLRAKPVQDLPPYIRAAISLTLNITSNLYPPQEKGKTVNVEKGVSVVVRIAVGQKP